MNLADCNANTSWHHTTHDPISKVFFVNVIVCIFTAGSFHAKTGREFTIHLGFCFNSAHG